ncbi:hypothetical protein VNO78_32753 [Psophocarpus tetragonolobus]|uniref:Uncharacterized protein n=1 Tax=Psophocarpus tetragonolobus TaxID=3891 RepID=A0AAN9P0X0_PSOTE
MTSGILKDKQTTTFGTPKFKGCLLYLRSTDSLARASFVAREKLLLRCCDPVHTYCDGDGSTYWDWAVDNETSDRGQAVILRRGK